MSRFNGRVSPDPMSMGRNLSEPPSHLDSEAKRLSFPPVMWSSAHLPPSAGTSQAPSLVPIAPSTGMSSSTTTTSTSNSNSNSNNVPSTSMNNTNGDVQGAAILDQLSTVAANSPYLAPQQQQQQQQSDTRIPSQVTDRRESLTHLPSIPYLSPQNSSSSNSSTSSNSGETASSPTSELQLLRTRVSELELVNDLFRSRVSQLETVEEKLRKTEDALDNSENTIKALKKENKNLYKREGDLMKTLRRNLRNDENYVTDINNGLYGYTDDEDSPDDKNPREKAFQKVEDSFRREKPREDFPEKLKKQISNQNDETNVDQKESNDDDERAAKKARV